MSPWKLGFVLPVILYVGSDAEATAVRSTGREPVVAPACDSATLENVTGIMCTAATVRSGGQACGLVYPRGQGSTHECDSRFSLRAENRTVFLHLTNLTPGDSGSYTCNCSHAHGVNQLHLDIRVQEGQSSSALTKLSRTTVIGNAAALVLVSGFVLGLALRKKRCRQRAEAGRCGLPACGVFCSLVLTTNGKAEPGDLYVNLQQLSADVHQQRARKTNPARNTKGSKITGRDPDQIYVNI